jgi:hypothetical protein
MCWPAKIWPSVILECKLWWYKIKIFIFISNMFNSETLNLFQYNFNTTLSTDTGISSTLFHKKNNLHWLSLDNYIYYYTSVYIFYTKLNADKITILHMIFWKSRVFNYVLTCQDLTFSYLGMQVVMVYNFESSFQIFRGQKLECSQGCYAVQIWPGDIDLWPWKSIGFQTLLMTKYVPSLVKIHWKMLILECSQGCYVVKNLRSCEGI